MENCHDFTQRNATPKPLLALVFSAFSLCAAPSYAETVETNETLMPKGMWKDPATGLIWDRCKLGQKWDGETCIRRPNKNILDLNDRYYRGQVADLVKQSKVGGYTDWELPNIVQLHSLLRCDKGFSHSEKKPVTESFGSVKLTKCAGYSGSNLDTHIFPNTDPIDSYWSSTHISEDWWWYLDLGNGEAAAKHATNGLLTTGNVRAVRTAESLGNEALLKIVSANTQAANELAAEQAAARELQAREHAEAQAAYARQNAAAQAAYNQRVAAFRRSVQVGDDTSQGVVIEIKGALIKIQTNESQCTQRDYRGSCSNYMNTPVEKWVKRSEIYPQ